MKSEYAVLYVVSFPFPGVTGTPLHAMGMAEAMKQRNVDVSVAHLRPWPLLKSELDTWQEIPVYRIGRPGWQKGLQQILKEFQPNVVHAHHIAAAVLSMVPCHREGIPLVYECHSFWREEVWEAGGRLSAMQHYYSWHEREAFEQSQHIIALSEKMKQTHIDEMDIPASKISVIYPGVKATWINNSTDAAVIPSTKPSDITVMYCGNFASYQGVDLLMQAFPRSAEACPELKLVLVGGSQRDTDDMRSRYPDAAQHAVFLGRHPYDEMPALLASADLLVIPRPNSRICWTMPRKFGEYLSAGRPILATDVGDHRLLIDRFDCGIATECTAESIAEGLVRFAKMAPSQRESMGRRSKAAAKEVFDWEKQMDRILELYETV